MPEPEAPSPSSPKARPRYRTRVLWGVLSGLFLLGLVCTVVGLWALSVAWGGGAELLWLPVGVLGILGAIFCLLLTLGIVYRVDRLRGNLTRRVEMFE
ncbi:MAG: hypothetical protein KGJ23_04195 [Euryarchaeota archaeon]|nr:hypothetical protein [Euryarchaeota archaeon]MDE1835800.1 hypothetical protein [Euryarchaeota archaeon]MDE1880726.1 hypothetical protein [Euryarchaeota archaeon]MDE2043991.1 hypothetical protein [Thermoplasmata archaeon]